MTAVFSPDGRWLLTATSNEFRLWEPVTWRPVRQIPREQGGDVAAGAAFAPDGKVLAVVDSLTTVRLFDSETWLPLARLQGPDAGLIDWIGFTPDGTRLLVCSLGGVLRVWDLRRIREQLAEARLDWDHPAYPPAPPPGSVKPMRVEVDPGILGREFAGHTGEIWWVGLSFDGRVAFSASHDKYPSARGTHRPGKSCVLGFRGHTDQVFGAAVSADGRRRLLSGGKDGYGPDFWDVESGRRKARRLDGARAGSPAWRSPRRREVRPSSAALTVLLDCGTWTTGKSCAIFVPTPRCGAWPFLLTIATPWPRGVPGARTAMPSCGSGT